MSGIRYSQEIFMGYPLPDDAVSFGSVSAANINLYVKGGGTVFSGSYSFPTVTINLKGIPEPPLDRPSAGQFGSSFSFRGKNYVITEVVEGAKFTVANKLMYLSWTVTGVDFSSPYVKV